MLGSIVCVTLLWFTSIPLGIPGEWTWDRVPAEPDFYWNLCGGMVAAAFFTGFVSLGLWRFGHQLNGPRRFEAAAWQFGLVVVSFGWLWIVQEIAPVKNRLGKSAFVLYYANSSGYFTRARYVEPDSRRLLAGYEELMREGDVLHTGTHPPGLFLAFHGLMNVCEASPLISSLLDASQPASFREAIDVIATNNLRRRVPTPLLPLDKRVLWLATLIVMGSAALTVIPLFGLLRRTCSWPTAWVGTALWTTLPALAIFIPKSDALFPLVGVTLLWCWLTAWDNRSLILSAVSGFIAWLGLICSLAFVPVFVHACLLSIGGTVSTARRIARGEGSEAAAVNGLNHFAPRHWYCLTAAVIAFFGPTLLLWVAARINLLQVWWLNYQNHAGFYQQYPRTYWKWLLVNPLELIISAGWPVALMAITACFATFPRRGSRQVVPARMGAEFDARKSTDASVVVVSTLITWGLLWLTGKNSGEAARLWIIFLPWLVWLAAISLERSTGGRLKDLRIDRRLVLLLVLQLLVSILTVTRVSGFHSESG